MISFEDKIAIQELSARYVLAVDNGDGDGRAETFLPDGVFEGGGGRFEGRAAIAEQTNAGRRNPQPNRWGALPGETQHWVQNYVIDGGADQATATAYVALVHVAGRILLVGRYYDTLRKVDGRWFFAVRRFEVSGSAANA
jgi:hypothetical protein